MATLYQKRTGQTRAGRDFTRLQAEFQKQMLEMNERQAKAFSDYTKQTSATMAPYEVAMEQYRSTLLPEYERQTKAYQADLASYEAQLADLKANPTITRTEQVQVPRGGIAAISPWKKGPLGRTKTITETYEEPRPVPTFEKTAPTMPAAPQAPSIGEFDTSEFKAQSEQLQARLQRELGERRGARLAATRRQPRQGLMSGA